MMRQKGNCVRLANFERLVRQEKEILEDKVRFAVGIHKKIDFKSAKLHYEQARIYAFGMLGKHADVAVDLADIQSFYDLLAFTYALSEDRNNRPYHHVYYFLKGGFGENIVRLLPSP
ncbi:hypothetical protein J4219_09175 [Candidatus Woesearchaeota archaeon]|nr:hypothetical protein [Candidatus Woesearchaeota archaeon]